MNTNITAVSQITSNGDCRLCGRQDSKLININSEEELQNDISNKIEMHIPIKLVESQEVSVLCCLDCISTIQSWHNFVLKVLETNRRLSSPKNVIPTPHGNHGNSEARDLQSPSSTSLQEFHPNPRTEIQKNYNCEHGAEETGSHSYFQSDSSEELEEKSENRKLENEADAPTQSHDFLCEYKSKEPLNHTDDKFLKNSDDEDNQNKISNKERGIGSKIDPKIIEAAKVIVGDRTYYNCKECGKSLLSPYTYVWHMRIHTGERPFMCDLCGKQFRVSQGLVRHLKETHKRIKNFPCDLCGRMFATKRNVDEHRRIHTNERPYVCALCSKSFKQKASLFVHNRTHSDHFPFKCDYCDQGFRTKPPLLIHVTKHTGQKPHPCDICGRCFRIKYELKRHKLVHSEEKPFVCSSCGLSFKQKRVEHIPDISFYSKREKDSENDLKEVAEETEQCETNPNILFENNSGGNEIVVNIPSKDDDSVDVEPKKNLQSNKATKQRRKKCEVERRYFCGLCDKAFTRKFDMQRHKKLKHKETDVVNMENRKENKKIIDRCKISENGKTVYECYICKQRTNQSYNLMRHISIHTGVKSYVCHVCGKSFRLDSSFRKHIQQFHEGIKNYRCEICDRNFGTKSARDEHLNTHSGYRPFSCDICEKSFKQKSSLYVHKLYHNKNFKFECAVCNKKFIRSQELAIHDRVHTGHKPYSCSVCDIKFRRSQDLRKHQRVHLRNDVEWVCLICKSTFSQERYLKLHKKVHEGIPRSDE